MAEKPDIKKIGLNLSEDVVKVVIKQIVRPYAEYYIEQSPNKIDDIILPFLDQIEKALLEVADKIDGEVA
jgi:regulator of PEP synthase PpsR (kinase-PPPase family)